MYMHAHYHILIRKQPRPYIQSVSPTTVSIQMHNQAGCHLLNQCCFLFRFRAYCIRHYWLCTPSIFIYVQY